jgi:hypothetical protein
MADDDQDKHRIPAAISFPERNKYEGNTVTRRQKTGTYRSINRELASTGNFRDMDWSGNCREELHRAPEGGSLQIERQTISPNYIFHTWAVTINIGMVEACRN